MNNFQAQTAMEEFGEQGILTIQPKLKGCKRIRYDPSFPPEITGKISPEGYEEVLHAVEHQLFIAHKRSMLLAGSTLIIIGLIILFTTWWAFFLNKSFFYWPLSMFCAIGFAAYLATLFKIHRHMLISIRYILHMANHTKDSTGIHWTWKNALRIEIARASLLDSNPLPTASETLPAVAPSVQGSPDAWGTHGFYTHPYLQQPVLVYLPSPYTTDMIPLQQLPQHHQ